DVLLRCLTLLGTLSAVVSLRSFVSFFLNVTATTDIYTLSLHDALPISRLMTSMRAASGSVAVLRRGAGDFKAAVRLLGSRGSDRSEEHTSELQSHLNLVCRLLLEKKNNESCYPSSTKHRFRH